MNEFMEKERQIDIQHRSPENLKRMNDISHSAEFEGLKPLKHEYQQQIADNDLRIRRLRMQMHRSGPGFKVSFQYRIETLQNLNASLEEKIAHGDYRQTSWQVFLAECKEDAESVAQFVEKLRMGR